MIILVIIYLYYGLFIIMPSMTKQQGESYGETPHVLIKRNLRFYDTFQEFITKELLSKNSEALRNSEILENRHVFFVTGTN